MTPLLPRNKSVSHCRWVNPPFLPPSPFTVIKCHCAPTPCSIFFQPLRGNAFYAKVFNKSTTFYFKFCQFNPLPTIWAIIDQIPLRIDKNWIEEKISTLLKNAIQDGGALSKCKHDNFRLVRKRIFTNVNVWKCWFWLKILLVYSFLQIMSYHRPNSIENWQKLNRGENSWSNSKREAIVQWVGVHIFQAFFEQVPVNIRCCKLDKFEIIECTKCCFLPGINFLTGTHLTLTPKSKFWWKIISGAPSNSIKVCEWMVKIGLGIESMVLRQSFGISNISIQ